jgi:tetratricopeptide (TPR) repeat protein
LHSDLAAASDLSLKRLPSLSNLRIKIHLVRIFLANRFSHLNYRFNSRIMVMVLLAMLALVAVVAATFLGLPLIATRDPSSSERFISWQPLPPKEVLGNEDASKKELGLKIAIFEAQSEAPADILNADLIHSTKRLADWYFAHDKTDKALEQYKKVLKMANSFFALPLIKQQQATKTTVTTGSAENPETEAHDLIQVWAESIICKIRCESSLNSGNYTLNASNDELGSGNDRKIAFTFIDRTQPALGRNAGRDDERYVGHDQYINEHIDDGTLDLAKKLFAWSERNQPVNSEDKAYLLAALGILSKSHKHDQDAAAFFQKSLAIWRESKLSALRLELTAPIVSLIGDFYKDGASLAQAKTAYELACKMWQELGIPGRSNLAITLDRLGKIEFLQGNKAAAFDYFAQSENLFRKIGQSSSLERAKILFDEADALWSEGSYLRALKVHQEASQLWRARA